MLHRERVHLRIPRRLDLRGPRAPSAGGAGNRMCEHVFPRSAAAYSTILALQLLQRAGPVTSATKPGADVDWRRQAWRPILQDMESRAQLRAELVDAIAKVNHQIWSIRTRWVARFGSTRAPGSTNCVGRSLSLRKLSPI